MEQREERQGRPAQSGKRAYEPPKILSEEVFETTALACGKRAGGGPACVMNRRS